jgi:5'-3' exonuclease
VILKLNALVMSVDPWSSPCQFLDMCLFAGCDYLPSIPGLGIKTAYKLIKQHRTFKKVSFGPRCLYS